MSKTTNKHPQFRLKPTCAAVMLAFTVQSVQANPVGGVVSSGQASFAASGNTLTVTNTPGAIINWQGFSIGANEITRFAQQSASSAVLNRVISNNPSSILGTLQSNGRVFLINPNGIVFGQGATVDVAGMVASTLNLSNADFQAGRYRFTSSNSPLPLGEGLGVRGVSNAGNITAQSGGQIYLIAPNVENTGVITAPNGEILLAAGHSVDLVDTANPNLRVNITAPAGDATNVGQLVAGAGSLGLFGTVVRNSGSVSANSAVAQGGKIVFRASQRVENTGIVTANSTAPQPTPALPYQGGSAPPLTRGGGEGLGGSIDLSGPSVALGGTISADGAKQGGTIAINAGGISIAGRISATGGSGQGGSIAIQSQTTNLNNVHATLDASGATGGTIREVAGHQITSSATYLATGTAGNGGKIDLSAPATKLLSAQIDASGATGGGQIRVGGEYQGGKNLAVDELPNAETLAVSAGSIIRADGGLPSTSGRGAGGEGAADGGTVILWSDLHSALYADVSAKPAGNGAGGFIELSSADKLTWGGTANAGVGGQVLMDPKNIVIQDAAAGGVQYNLTLGYNYVNLPRMSGSNLEANDLFGSAVSLSGTQLAVGAQGDDGSGNAAPQSGAVYLFDNPYTTPTLSGTIGKGYTGAGNYDLAALGVSDAFGYSVSLSGTQLAVGAYVDGGSGNIAAGSGAVYLFNNPFGATALSGIIGKGYTGTGGFDVTALETGDNFGSAVSLSGTQLAVGAWADDGFGNVATDNGAVYLFNNPFSTPTLSGTIGKGYAGAGNYDLAALGMDDAFGFAVSLSGTQLAVGAPGDSGFSNVALYSGAVYLFNNPFGATTLSGTIGLGYVGTGDFNLTTLAANDNFGRSVSLSGTQLAVGAHGDDGFGNAVSASGAVYLFNNPFTTPTLSGTIGKGYTGTGNFDPGDALAAGDHFGSAVSLFGTQLAVGAMWDDGFGDAVSGSGAVYLFNDPYTTPTLSGIIGNGYTGAGNFNLTSLEVDDRFGWSVSLSGTQLAVGAWWDDGFGNAVFNSGAVYLFNNPFGATALSGIIGKGYTGTGNFDVAALESDDQFGSAVSLSGTQLAVGAWWDDSFNNVGLNEGAVYLFNNPFGATALSGIIGNGYVGAGDVNLTLAVNDLFGTSVSLMGTQLAVGASGDDGFNNTASSSGAVYLFNNLDTTPTLFGTIGQGYVGTGDFNLTALGGGGLDAFGSAVSLSGTQLAVGAAGDDGFGNTVGNSGAVYLLNNPFGATTLSGIIGKGYVGTGDYNLSALEANDRFGTAISLSGTQLAVGTDWDDGPSNLTSSSGAVYLFTLVAGGGDPAAGQTFSASPGADSTITPASITAILNTGSALTLQANNDITVMDAIIANNLTGNGGALAMQAGRSILVNANITTDNGILWLIANDTLANGVVTANRDVGAAQIAVASGVTLNAGTGSVNLQVLDGAGRTGTQATAGDITLSNTIIAGAISVLGSANILLNGTAALSLTSNGGIVLLNSDWDGLNGGAISMAVGSSITSNGGNVTLGGGTAGNGTGNAIGTGYVNGITLDGASINAGGGNVSLRGTGVAGTGSWRYGVFLQNGATVTSTGPGAITLDGTGGANINGNYGVMLETSSQISSVDGAIAITGHGIGTTLENVGVGVQLNAKIISTGAGTITLNGTGGGGTDTNRGVYIDGAGTTVTSANGNISITGQGAGTGFDNRGIYISGGAKVKATGAGNVALDGTGSAAGTDYNYGVYVKNSGTEVSAASGAVSITGRGAGSGTDNYGIWVTNFAKVASAGAGAITLDGFGGASTGSSNTGAYVSSSATISATGTGGIILNGTGGSSGTAGLSNRGVRISSAASISTDSGTIGITGTGGYEGDGVQVVGGAVVRSSTGAITLDGTAVDGSSDAAYVSDAGTLVTSGGNISITGHNLSTLGGSNRGVAITSSAQVVATGAATITMTGQGGYEGDGLHVHGGALVQSGTGLITLSGTSGDGTGTNWDWGVEVGDPGTLVTSGGGMTITGVSTSTDSASNTHSNYGLFVRTGAKLTTTAGLMTLTGTKGAGATSDAVLLSGTPAGGVVNAAAGLTIYGLTGDVVVDTGTILNVAGNANISTYNNILFAANSSLVSSAGAVNVSLDPGYDGGSGGIYLDTGSSIYSNGGGIQMGSASTRATGNGTVTGGKTFDSGITVLGDITAGAGNITMYGEGANSGSNHLADGIMFAGGLLSSNGTVIIDGKAHVRSETTAGTEVTAGVDFLGGGTRLSTQTGTVMVTGLNNAPAGFARAQGITVGMGTIIETTGTGTLTLNGTSTGYDTGWGVGIFGGTVQTTAAGGGALTLNGSNTSGLPDGGVVVLDGNVLSNGGAISMTGQGLGGAVGIVGTSAVGGTNSGNIQFAALDAGPITIGSLASVNAGASTLTILADAGGTATLTGISANNVSVTASGGIFSGSNGAATDITATGTVALTGQRIGSTTYRLGVSAGGATTLTTTGAGTLGNVYLRADTAMTLGSITTDAATSQVLYLDQALGGTLTMPANQASNNDGWIVTAPTGITFLPGSSLMVGYANFTSAGGITAQGDLSMHALTGDLYFGNGYGIPITANGIVNLLSDTGSLTLGKVTTTNTGLPVTTAAINVSAPLGYIDLNDNLNATGSGGISLTAFNTIDLDRSDIAPNLITAAGNVNIQSTNGSITNSGSAEVTGANVSLDGALGVDTGEVITATTGSVTVLAAGGTAALEGIAAATGVSVTAGSITNSYGNIATTAGNISLASASDITLYGYWGGNALTTSGGNVLLKADSDGLNGGAIAILGAGSITSNGGDITLGGGSNPLATAAIGTASNPVGVLLDGATINSGAGNISILGQGLGDGGSYRHGVSLIGGSMVQAAGGTITITGTGGNNASGDSNFGVHLDGAGTLIASTAGAITVTGTGGSGASQTNSYGVSVGYSVGGAVIQGVGNAIVNVTGTGGTIGGDNSRGVIVRQSGSKITAQNGAINIVGTGPSATYGSVGVQLWGDGNIESTGSGAINITGTAQNNNSLGGGAPATNFIGGPTATGDIFITGNQSISFGSGVSNPFNIQTSGNVTINATGNGAFQYGAGSIQSAGLRLLGSGTFSLDSASNNVGTLAANVTGNVTYNDTNGFAIGSVTSFDGTAATTTTGVTTTGSATINAAGAITTSGGVVTANTLNVTAVGGIALTTQVANLITSNTGAGNTLINNTGALTTNGMTDTSGSITLNNAGDMTLSSVYANGITLTASGAASDIFVDNNVTSTGGMTIIVGGNMLAEDTVTSASGMTINVGGNLTLDNWANDGAILRSNAGTQTVTVGGNLDLGGGGNLISGAAGQAINVTGSLSSQGGEINSGAATTLRVGSDLILSNGGTVWSDGSLYGSIGGNVTITGGWSGAGLFGTPDIGSAANPFSVGGVITMDDGGGYYNNGARIHSDSMASIWIHFPNLSSGGYFVNGAEGVVSSGLSGFYASGSPAFLDSNLHITYGPASVPGNNLSFLPDLVNTMLIAGGGASGASRSTIGGVMQGMIGSNDKKPEPDPLPVCPL